MSDASVALLLDRGVVSVTGPDAATFLDNLVTNDVSALIAPGDAIHAALLSPQGKILFEFFIVRTTAGFLLETALSRTAALAKRLALYKLRAKVEIKDAAGELVVAVMQGHVAARPGGATAFVDPRDARLGDRVLIPASRVDETIAQTGARRITAHDYHAQRLALGVPEADADYVIGDAFPHEAGFDLLHGVSFTKGCFVGQEVVARMQNKTVVRKRVVRVEAEGLAAGAEVRAGEAVIGRVGSAAGSRGLAMVRLDRVAEALDKGQPLTIGGAPAIVDPAAVAAFRQAVANRPVIDL
jgi:hypothetical protein